MIGEYIHDVGSRFRLSFSPGPQNIYRFQVLGAKLFSIDFLITKGQ